MCVLTGTRRRFKSDPAAPRELIMIYVDIKPEVWAKKWGLDIVQGSVCPNCSKTFPYTKPVMFNSEFTGKMVGFESELHECGKQYIGAIFTPATTKGNDWWRNAFQKLRSRLD